MPRYRVTFSDVIERVLEWEVTLDKEPDQYDVDDLYDIANTAESSILLDEGESGYAELNVTNWREVPDDGDEATP